MDTFNYGNNRVVGIVEDIPHTDNARINIIGVIHKGVFHRIYNAKKFFKNPKYGYVFAYKFAQSYPNMSKHCVILRVKPFEGKETEAGVLVWNDKANVVDLGSPLKNIPLDSIADDGQKNHNILCRYNLINIKQDVYIKSYKYIYLIQPNSCEGIVKYWSYGDWLPSLNEACINVNGELYVIGSLPKHTGSRDIMSDEQLVDWFCKKIITPRWNEIVSRQDFEITESCIKDELNCYNLDSNVYNSRLNRINSICKNFQLYSLQKNTTLSLLSQFLKDSLSNHNAELQELRGMYDLDLKTEIKEKLDEAIEKKRLKLKDLETKQTAIENNIGVFY